MRLDPLIIRSIWKCIIYLALYKFTGDVMVALTFFGGLVLAQCILDVFFSAIFPGTWREMAKNFNETLSKKIKQAEEDLPKPKDSD
ncbi:MAG TPA: hypothetical protein VM577_04945 [Anaerovoracaceae bacterium]|nr:hypothetical protein [Anaerovoracaceae bacterium]